MPVMYPSHILSAPAEADIKVIGVLPENDAELPFVIPVSVVEDPDSGVTVPADGSTVSRP